MFLLGCSKTETPPDPAPVINNVSNDKHAVVELSAADSPNFGTVIIGKKLNRIFTIKNTGSAGASNFAIGVGASGVFGFQGASYPGTTGTCGGSLGSGESCTINVVFAPSTNATSSEIFKINYKDGETARSLTLTVVGSGGAQGIVDVKDATPIAFGSVVVGLSGSKTITLQNNSDESATGIKPGAASSGFSFGATNCDSIAARSTCSVTINYQPTAAGTASTNLSIAYTSTAGEKSLSVPVTATAVTPGALSLALNGAGFADTILGQSSTRLIKVTNSGATPASNIVPTIVAPFAFTGGNFPGTGGDCATQLAGGMSCLLSIDFKPTASGASSKNLTLNYRDGVKAQLATLTLSGKGLAPASLAATAVAFGKFPFGATMSQTITVTNNGDVSAAVGATTLVSNAQATLSVTGGTCAAKPSLAKGQSCTIQLKAVAASPANPVDASFALSATLAYSGSSDGKPLVIGVGGNLVLPAKIQFASPLDFGLIPLGDGADRTVTLKNDGEFTAKLTIAAPTPATVYSRKGGTCAATLDAKASCTIILTLKPSVDGVIGGTLPMTIDDGARSAASALALTGRGGRAKLAFDFSTFDFGAVPSNQIAAHVFRVTNSGTLPALNLRVMLATSASPFLITGSTCSTTLAVGASCLVTITYPPKGTAVVTDSLNGSYVSSATTPSVAITGRISGHGGPAVTTALQLLPSTGDFGTKLVGGSTDLRIVVKNTGTSAVTFSAPVFNAPFSYRAGTYPGAGGTCTDSLIANGSCIITLSFQPKAAGTFSQPFIVSGNDGATASFLLTGKAVTSCATTTYGLSNLATVSFSALSSNLRSEPSQVTTQMLKLADGSVIVLGAVTGGFASPRMSGLVKYLCDGSLDLSFGKDGRVLVDALDTGALPAMVGTSDGKILVTGKKPQSNVLAGDYNSLVRMNANGSKDTSFELSPFFTSGGAIRKIALDSQGILVIGGTTHDTLRVERYLSSGSPDVSYGNRGIALANIASTVAMDSLIIRQNGDRLSVATRGQGVSYAVSFAANGTIAAPAFSTRQTSLGGAVMFSDNSWLFVGTPTPASNVFLEQLILSTGVVGGVLKQYSLGSNGTVSTLQFGAANTMFLGSERAIVHLLADGSPDAQYPVRSAPYGVRDLVAGADGSVLYAGQSAMAVGFIAK